MIGRWSAASWARPWIAGAMAYVVALQIVLAGLASSRMISVGDFLSGEAFVTCLNHAGVPDTDSDRSGKVPTTQDRCAFCTLAHGSAILPVALAILLLARLTYADLVMSPDEQVVGYDSPTGQYQRGPPAAAFAAG